MSDVLSLYEPALARPEQMGLVPEAEAAPVGVLDAAFPEFTRMVAPTAAGVAAFPAGVGVGAAVGGPFAPATGLIGGFAAAIGAGFATEIAQDELTPEPVKRMLGWDDAARQAAADAHPYAVFGAQLAPQLLFMRPSWNGAMPALAGGAIGGGVEAGVELASEGEVDFGRVAAQAAFGATLGRNTRFGDLIQIPAHAVVSVPYGAGVTAAYQGARDTLRAGIDAVASGQEATLARLFPKLPESVQRRWAAAGTLDDRLLMAAAEADIGPRMTPDERAAIFVMQQELHARDSSPFLPGVAADAAAGARLGASTAALLAGERIPGMPWEAAPRVGSRPDWHDAIEGIESGGRQTAADGSPLTSSAGAIGVMQVMPGTAPYAAKLAGVEFDPRRYRTDAAYNRMLGRAYFDEMLRQFDGDAVKAAAAYNAGPGSAKSGRGVRGAMARAAREGEPGNWVAYLPAETQAYVAKFADRTGTTARAPEGPILDPAHFPDEDSWALAQDAIDAERIGAEDWAASRPAEDAAAIGEAGAAARGAEFDALARLGDLDAYVRQGRKPITPTEVGEALGIPADHAARLIGKAARQDDPGFRLVNGRAIRNPTFDGPEDVLSFVARNGGVISDDRHMLGKGGRDWNRVLVAGRGPLARRSGIGVDDMGEKLWDAGYFGAGAERPDESAVMELIERAVAARGERRKVYRPEEQAEIDAKLAEAQGADELANLRDRYEAAMEEAGVPGRLSDADVAGIRAIGDEIGAADDIDAIDAWFNRPVEDGEFIAAEPDDYDAPFALDDSEALARFDEPGGEGDALQLASIEHDLRMTIDADPEWTVRIGDNDDDVSVVELLAALDDDAAAVERLRACAMPARAAPDMAMGSAA